MTEVDRQTQHVYEVEITYSTDEVANKLITHQLSPEHVYNKAAVDQSKLAQLKSALAPQSPLIQLCSFMQDWESNGDPAAFVNNLNQLIFHCMQAIEADESIQKILSILKCLQIKSGFSSVKTAKFHLFVDGLLIETLQQYHLATLDYLLNYDDDLKLPNANQIEENLEKVITNADDKSITALLSVHFQTENNNFLLPKEISTELNKQLAAVILKNIPEETQLYFVGDFQFSIIMPNIVSKTQLHLARVKIAGAFEEIVFINKLSMLVKPFIGCFYTESNAISAQTMLENAKLALEHAILKHKYYVEYDDALEDYINEQIAVESKILEAFDSNNLTLAFQPIVDTKQSKCIGAEVLLRWPEKFGLNFSPALTVEVLNNAGKGNLFIRWLINSTCRYAYELTVERNLNVYLTVNLRAEDLYDLELPSLFSNALSLWKLDPKNIILEITESGILEYNENTNSVINALSSLGFRFALDDFGTGFSSLTRLRTLPIDLIKIDQSFVKNINNSEEDFKIVTSITTLASSLGKDVLAEGVENSDCLKRIQELNITKCQGYYFSKPMTYPEYIEFVKNN